MNRIIFLFAFSFIVNPVIAIEYTVTTKIKSIYIGPGYGKKVFIEVKDKPTGERPAGCNRNANFDFILDLKSEHGKEYYSAILALYASGKTLRLQSYDSCNLHNSVPDLKTIWLQ